MPEPLGLGVIPGAGWNAAEIGAVAREAEDAGFDANYAAEVNNDVLATAQLMGSATRHIKVGTCVANIYLRHPYVCAQGAGLIAEMTEGRMVLGLGVSHQLVNRALGVEMPSPREALRKYVVEVGVAPRRGAGDTSTAASGTLPGADSSRRPDFADRRAGGRTGRRGDAGLVVTRAGCSRSGMGRARPH